MDFEWKWVPRGARRSLEAIKSDLPMLRAGEYNAQSAEVKVMLGLGPKQKLPRDGMEPQKIQGVVVWVEKMCPGMKGRKPHRVLALCPKCDKILSAGRLHQHMTVHLEAPKALSTEAAKQEAR